MKIFKNKDTVYIMMQLYLSPSSVMGPWWANRILSTLMQRVQFHRVINPLHQQSNFIGLSTFCISRAISSGYQPSASADQETGHVRIQGKRAVTPRKSIRQSLINGQSWGFRPCSFIFIWKRATAKYSL